jgi:aldehyde dehydrogenase (NAD+)
LRPALLVLLLGASTCPTESVQLTEVKLIERESLFVGGSWVPPAGPNWLQVVSPSTEETIGRVPFVTQPDVDAAVGAARKAFDTGPWPRMSIGERSTYLRSLAEWLEPRIEDLSRLQVDEMGAPIRWIRASTSGSIRDRIGQEIETASSVVIRSVQSQPWGETVVTREPVGVVAAIIPWNAPAGLVIDKLLTALLSGCAVVVKPAPETPLDACVIADGIEAVGLPTGLVSILPADRQVGEYLVSHAGVDKVSFTGSTAAGRRIAQICGSQIKRVTLELGGKSAGIILDDVDLARVLPDVVRGALQNTGQICAAITRILVPRSRQQEITDALVSEVSTLVVGDPHQEQTDVGPLVAARQRDRVEEYVASGVAEGATLTLGGGRPPHCASGWFFEPTVFTDVDNSMRIAREEIFGPVVSVIPYADDLEAALIANDSSYGLSGAIFTEDAARGLTLAQRIRTGSMTINGFVIATDAPFGGRKESGIGREFGVQGYDAYLEYKTTNLMERL